MKLLQQIEAQIHTWMKNVPHLPDTARQWLGRNVWWIVLIGAVFSGISILYGIFGVVSVLSILTAVNPVLVVAGSAFAGWSVITSIIGLVVTGIGLVLSVMAIKPLQEKQKKGWVLLFGTWLVYTVNMALTALLSLNPFTFVITILFGAAVAAAAAYFLFEIHGEFAHPAKKTTKKTS